MQSNVTARPAITDLTFQVHDWPFHPELIDNLLVHSFEREGYRLRLHLTPDGHMVDWRFGKIWLVEILTEQTRMLPGNRQVFAHRIGGERVEALKPRTGVSYQTCFQVERMTPAIFFRFHDELRQSGEKNGVLHLMHPQDRMGLSPMSFVDLQARKGSVLIHAYHTYPCEYAVVKSQSLIDFAAPG